MKKFSLIISIFATLNSCSLFGTSTEDIPTVLPPENKTTASNVVITKPNSGKSNSSNSTAYINHQTKIIENRGIGGSVDQIKVDNPGNMPDYYIYPAQEQNLNRNNQPDKIATPTWQINW